MALRRPVVRFAACLLVGACSPCAAQIRILSPPSLVEQLGTSRIDGATTTFGAPFYGDRVLGRVVWGPSLKGKNHCAEDDYELPPPPQTESWRESKLINIALVRRGGCSLNQKVRVAMAKGAHAVIIVDKEDSEWTDKDMPNVHLAEDGTAQDVHIPSVFISKERGRDLIYAAASSEVIVVLRWDVPTNHVVATDLWMSSASRESSKFLKGFAKNRRALNGLIMFTPHYSIFGMDPRSASAQSVQALCSDSSGRYCAEDPDGEGPITGKEVIEEDLRQLCLHQLTKVERPFHTNLMKALGYASTNTPAYSKEFWDYIERFPDECPLDGKSVEHQFGATCSQSLMRSLGINVNSINQCVKETKEQKLQEQRNTTAWSPRALRINGWRYSGVLDTDLVTRAICSGFVTTPAQCEDFIRPRDPFQAYGAATKGHTFFNFGFFDFIRNLLLILVVVGVAMFFYMDRQKKAVRFQVREEVMLEVQAAMENYGKLHEVIPGLAKKMPHEAHEVKNLI